MKGTGCEHNGPLIDRAPRTNRYARRVEGEVHISDHPYSRSGGLRGSEEESLMLKNGKDIHPIEEMNTVEDVSKEGLEAKLTWQDMYIVHLEDILTQYRDVVQLCHQNNAKLQTKIQKLEQQLERKNRRLSTKPGLVGNGPSDALNTSSTGRTEDGNSRSGAKRPAERQATTLGSKTPAKLAALSLTNRGCAKDQVPRAAVPVTSNGGGGQSIEAQNYKMLQYLGVHDEFLSKLTSEAATSARRTAKRKELETPLWWIEKQPFQLDSARSRRSQGTHWSADISNLMAHEFTKEEDLMRICKRGENDERRRIRWDLQLKRELGKRVDSEGSENCSEDGDRLKNPTTVNGDRSDSAKGYATPPPEIKPIPLKSGLDMGPVDRISFHFDPHFL